MSSVTLQSNLQALKCFSCHSYLLNTRILSVSEDPVRQMIINQCSRSTDCLLSSGGFSEVEMEALLSENKSPNTDVPVGVYSIAAGMGTGELFDSYDEKQDINSIKFAGLPFFDPYESSGNRSHDNTVQFNQWFPQEEVVTMEPHMNMAWLLAESNAFPVDAVKMEGLNEFNFNLEGEEVNADLVLKNMFKQCRQQSRTAEVEHSQAFPMDVLKVEGANTFNYNSKDEEVNSDIVWKNMTRQCTQRSKTAEIEHNRRSLITKRIKALENLLPQLSEVKRSDQESIMDNAIAHVKYLQFQLKELSRSRLGSISVSAPLNFVEGYGHYHPHDQMLKEALEEEVGSLLEGNPAKVLRLMECKGLCMMPLTSLDGLRSAD